MSFGWFMLWPGASNSLSNLTKQRLASELLADCGANREGKAVALIKGGSDGGIRKCYESFALKRAANSMARV